MIKPLTSGLKKLFPLALSLCLLLPANAFAQDQECKELKKVNNLDELLYQIYINLDSDCLFTTPLAELEKVWGIKIMSEERLRSGRPISDYSKIRNGADFEGKPYNSEIDVFFVESDTDRRRKLFTIDITQAYFDAYGTLFPAGSYPRLIPEPIKMLRRTWQRNNPLNPSRPIDNPGEYSGFYHYYWLNTDRSRMILISPYVNGAVSRIDIFNDVTDNFINDLVITENE